MFKHQRATRHKTLYLYSYIKWRYKSLFINLSIIIECYMGQEKHKHNFYAFSTGNKNSWVYATCSMLETIRVSYRSASPPAPTRMPLEKSKPGKKQRKKERKKAISFHCSKDQLLSPTSTIFPSHRSHLGKLAQTLFYRLSKIQQTKSLPLKNFKPLLLSSF